MRAFLSGLLVGAADIVPGISGGTVAFIIGIYDELLLSITKLSRKNLAFITLFVMGVACSFATLAKGFQYILNDELLRPFLYSAFMGLVVGSCFFCAKLITRFTLKTLLFLVLGAVSAYLLSGADFAPKSNEQTFDVPLAISVDMPVTNFDADKKCLLDVPQSHLAVMLAKKYISNESIIAPSVGGASLSVKEALQASEPPLIDLWIVACGAMAISAMLLPGISGSYLLNILGMYGFILGALVDWLEGLKMGLFDFASFRTVFSMGLGIIIGATIFARVVRFALRCYKECTIATLVGFMVGALGSVWPFWSYAFELSALNLANGPILHPQEPILPTFVSSQFALAIGFFVFGVAAVFFIEYLAGKKVRSSYADSHSGDPDSRKVCPIESV